MSTESSDFVARRRHILTVSVEDYFHVGSFAGTVRRKHWDRFEPRIATSLARTLELLGARNVKATFFVLGCIAEQNPDLVRRIVAEGHEVASSGFWPRGLSGMVPAEFREDLARTKAVLEAAGAPQIRGYRSPRSWLTPRDLWILDVLVEEGYAYDSSINPVLRRFAAQPWRFSVHQHRSNTSNRALWELPISTISICGVRVAISGGNYVRQLPDSLLHRAVTRWHQRKSAPLVFYFMPWELDPEQPRLSNLSSLNRIRHYRNLTKPAWVFDRYFQEFEFETISEFLGLARAGDDRAVPEAVVRAASELDTGWSARPESAPVEVVPAPALPAREVPAAPRQPVTLVIPFFNESDTVQYLRKTVLQVRQRLSRSYELHLVLVDDGSTDDTWNKLIDNFQSVPRCELIRHDANQGVAAALMTGIRNAPTETVCSMDCDCSYDPDVLESMIPLLRDADMVTASPYHPDGHVVSVQRWRLFLSRTLSRLYSLVLWDRLYTFTSCCRVYRKSLMSDLHPRNRGFLGVAEMLIMLKLRGGKIAEYPATLESRLLGESKMKTLQTIRGHLKLLRDLAIMQLTHGPRSKRSPRPGMETLLLGWFAVNSLFM